MRKLGLYLQANLLMKKIVVKISSEKICVQKDPVCLLPDTIWLIFKRNVTDLLVLFDNCTNQTGVDERTEKETHREKYKVALF
jgi:hypothetical protein